MEPNTQPTSFKARVASNKDTFATKKVIKTINHSWTDLIPLYQGHEDFVQAFSDRGTYKRLPTFLLYSPTPEGKTYLKKETESIKDKEHPTLKEKLLAHFYMISDYAMPVADHLKEEIKAKKKSNVANNKGKRQKGNQTPSQGAKKKFIKKFLNIKTGQIETEKDLRTK